MLLKKAASLVILICILTNISVPQAVAHYSALETSQEHRLDPLPEADMDPTNDDQEEQSLNPEPSGLELFTLQSNLRLNIHFGAEDFLTKLPTFIPSYIPSLSIPPSL